MRRTRLIAALAAVPLVVTGPAAAASAQGLPLPDLGEVLGGGDGCLELGELSLGDLASLDPGVCVTDEGVRVDVGAVIADTEVPTGAVTDVVEGTTGAIADAVGPSDEERDRGRPSRSPAPDPAPEPEPDGAAGGGSASPGTPTGGGGGDQGPDATADDQDGAAAGLGDDHGTRDLSGIRALRMELARGVSLDRGVAGPVTPLDLATSTGRDAEVADPLVASPRDLPLPGTAPSDGLEAGIPRDEAVFATSPTAPDTDEVPLLLEVLAATLLVGVATVWTLARRALGPVGATV